MRGSYLVSSLLILLCGLVYGQPGNYFLSHYAPTDENIDYLSFDIAQTDRGIIYFANKTGVVEFDGRNWNVIQSPGAIYTLAISNGNEVYVGGLTGFGRLGLSANNTLAYEALSKADKAKNIFKSVALEEHVYFINENHFFGFNVKTKETDTNIDATAGSSFNGLFEIENRIYVSDNGSNFYELKDNKLVASPFPFLAGEELLFVDKISDGSRYLLGTVSGRFFSYEKNSAEEIKIEDDSYVNTNVVVSGKWVNGKLIALGTLSGGVVFINPATGKTEEIINYYTGLPDNEVFALMTDRNEGVWAAHDYGFTRIAPYLPFRTYNHYPGLSGNLLSAYSDSSKVFVGTSVGLYKLNKEEIFTEETYFVTRLQKASSATGGVEDDKSERKKSRKGLFSFLKRDKNKEEETKEPGSKESGTKEGSNKVVVKKTRKVLSGLDYAYKKVTGIEGKVTYLMNVENKLLAAGVGGIFEIRELKAIEISNVPVRAVFYSPTLKQVLVSTYNDKVRTYQSTKDGWRETFLLDTIRAYVGNIFEDHTQNIWLCGRADVLKVEMIDGEISATSSVPFTIPVFDETMGFALGSNVFVAASGSFHRYDAIKHQFVKYDSLPGPRKYFTSLGTFWFNDGHRWRTVDRKLQNSLRLEWLGLFPDIRALTTADNGNGLWLITADNELYKFTKTDLQEIVRKYPLFLREVRGPQNRLTAIQLNTIDQQESALSFEFIQPEYTNALAIEYQYMIEGISKTWSDWSTSNNVVNFPFLTPGDYQLRIKSRDLFGQISELQSIDFRVIPPYWKQTWFYALEFVFFAMLVIISLRLSAANSRYRHISQLLSILTVLMLIQLMQNTAESFITVQTTPVMDFFIQVSIALLILPLEYKMRRFMVEASEGKYNLKGLKSVKH